jgi:hypothetical protein
LGFFEVDAGTMQFTFPGRLLLKPVSTARLVLVPMLFGGAITVALFVMWTELVLRHFIAVPASSLLWMSTGLLSLFWWMQALAWSLSLLKGRVLALLIVAVVHLLVLLMPRMPTSISSGWQWRILAALLVSAVPAAWVGLKLMRQGRWESPSRISRLWSQLRLARARGRRKKFGSAFGAQFWLEWQRQGLLLPGISGAIVLLASCVIIVSKKLGEGYPPPEVILSILLGVPLLFSSMVAPALAKFDPVQSTPELPIYIAVRPMTNGGFVMAKLVMALASSALTWLVTVAAACLCLAIMGKGTLFSKAGSLMPHGPVEIVIGCILALLLLIILSWKNLVAGIGAGLTGRQWIVTLFTLEKWAFYAGLLLLGINGNFRAALLHWVPGLLIVCLAAKIAFSICAFVWGLRRNAITARAAGWIIGGWSVCGLFVAGYAGLVCHAINKPDLWIWVALAGFLVLPLADLAIAPLALAWNRHR